MIYVDPRIGSGDLVDRLHKRGVAAQAIPLGAGDVAIFGSGPEGRTIPVGVEIKTITEVLEAVKGDARFGADQIRRIAEAYEIAWLLVEGVWGTDDDDNVALVRRGGLQTYQRGKGRPVKASSMRRWLLSIQIQGGLRLAVSSGRPNTVEWLEDLAAWWSEPWESHKSVGGIYLPNLTEVKRETERGLETVTSLEPVTVERMVAACLPGIGNEKSSAVADHFGSIRAMVEADEAAWRLVPGIGKTLAGRITKAIRGGR